MSIFAIFSNLNQLYLKTLNSFSLAKKTRKLRKQIQLNLSKNQSKRVRSHTQRLINWKLGIVIPFEKKRVSTKTKAYERVKAPTNFSFFQNTEEILRFAARLKKMAQYNKNVFINLSDITNLTNDAIVVLISILTDFGRKNLRVQGNYPKNELFKDKLEQSGFFEYVYGYVSTKNRNPKTAIYTKFSREVECVKSYEIVKRATGTVFNTNIGSEDIQRVLVELMMNTFKHADPNTEAAENWWLSIEHDINSKKVTFAFIDNGVGILHSINKLAYKQGLLENVKSLFKNNIEILIDILDAKIKSRTGLIFRGKGLPAILGAFKRNSFSNLTIITNNVYANLDTGEYRIISPEFSGTLIYFELTSKNILN